MKNALKLIAALFFYAAFSISSTSAAEPEKMFFENGSMPNVTLVVILARDAGCRNYAGRVEAAGWKKPTPSAIRRQYACYLTIGEVDLALACYQGQNRIGTRVIDTHPEGNSCQTDTVSQLVGLDADNIIRDFEQDGYPDGCNADGCGDGGLSSGGDGEAPSE